MADDDELSAALALSAAEARARADAPLQLPRTGNNTGAAQARELLGPPLDHHFGHRDGRVARGCLRSAAALDQFAPQGQPMIERHGVASSVCGYVTAANVELLCRRAAALLPPPPPPPPLLLLLSFLPSWPP